MDLQLIGKNAIVTGGASGLGLAIGRILQEEGARPVIIDLKQPVPDDIIDTAIYLRADLSNLEQVQGLMAQVCDKVNAVDILVNCAGFWPTCFVKDMSLEQWTRTIDINMTSAFLLCRDFVNHCIEAKRPGVILNITSQAAFGGATSGHAHYAAAKAALVNFTRSLAREVAEFDIRVNAISPGMMNTPMASEAIAERCEAYLKRIPLGRIAEPSEIAAVAVFLCSHKAGYMTGATVDVSGGMLMH